MPAKAATVLTCIVVHDLLPTHVKLQHWDLFTVNIWDTAGQERFRSIAKAFYNKAQGALICFDLTSQESFNEVKNWSNSIAQNCTNTDVATVLVGCKADLEDERVVSQEDAER